MRNLVPENIKRSFRVIRSQYGAFKFGNPAKKLKLIGVTGTSGKSTTANMIYHILGENGYKVGVISTIGAKAGKKSLDTGFHVTTPDPYDLQKYLKFMVDRDIEYCVVECSSHALEQGRLGKIQFDYSVFTNIKRDHLDWHKSWNNYARAKARLADATKPEGKIILNRDDKSLYDYIFNYIGSKRFQKSVITYSIKELVNIDETAVGTRFTYGDYNFKLPLLGLYNIENALAAINVTSNLGLSFDSIANGLATFIGLEGRMQVMQPSPFIVVVDFAHNTDSLIKSLITAKKLKSSEGKIISVFGSAGQRDVEKRYTMGEAAAQNSDVIVITAEDPRTESLYNINTQIIEGATKGGGKLVARFANTDEYLAYNINKTNIETGSIFVFDEETVNSRFDAIEFAIRLANPGDVVITEGKGHEESLCFGKIEYEFTDQAAVRRAIDRLKAGFGEVEGE